MSSTPSPTDDGPDLVRRPGRPRDARTDAAILEATLEVAGTEGLAGLTIDAVAARAGVGKATIYRRWSSKEALVLDAWMACVGPLEVPDEGDLRTDLLVLYCRYARNIGQGVLAKVLPQMIAAARVHPDLADVHDRWVADRRARARTVLERAQVRGELPADADLDLVQDLITGPLFLRTLGGHAVVDDDTVAEVVDTVLAGVRRKI